MTDFDTWLRDYGDRLYRYWVYKKMFTPEEQAGKYIDQSCFEDEHAQYGYIVEAAVLPDGDILLGFQWPSMKYAYIDYYKLSEITLAWCENDASDLQDVEV